MFVHRQNHPGRRAALFLGVASLGLLIAPIAASASPHKKLTPLQQGKAFYAGKQLLFISPGQVGGTFDINVRQEALYMSQYLHASYTVENVPQGNTIPGSDQIAAAQPNGLTLGLLNPTNDASLVLTNTPGLNFNPERMAYIAANAGGASALVVTNSSPYQSFADLRNSATPINMLTESSGTANTILRAWMGVIGVKTHFISGYGSLGTLVLGFQRGDGQAAYINLTNVGPLLEAGQARVLAVNNIPPVGTEYRAFTLNKPTIATLFKQYPPKNKSQRAAVTAVEALNGTTSDPLVTQTSVSEDKVLALRVAAQWAFEQPGFQQTLLQGGLNPKYINPVAAKQAYIQALTDGKTIVCYIEATC